uniref:Uncharacterized protein n=1 Tax=Rhizophora mucronata TaxID=61149 RepID=A0A2P2Q0F9_RHIMU
MARSSVQPLMGFLFFSLNTFNDVILGGIWSLVRELRYWELSRFVLKLQCC